MQNPLENEINKHNSNNNYGEKRHAQSSTAKQQNFYYISCCVACFFNVSLKKSICAKIDRKTA